MAVNRGKQFESVIQEAFEHIPNLSITRLHDQTTGFKGSTNPCDFIAYHKPYLIPIECKSKHTSTLSIFSNPKPDKNGVLHGFYGDITDKQWAGLLEMSLIKGVIPGVLVWFVDKNVTVFYHIKSLEMLRNAGDKSVRYDNDFIGVVVPGVKKRVFFEYDMEQFLKNLEDLYGTR